MLLNHKSHPYLFTYDTNNPECRETNDNTYFLARGNIPYDYWFCQFTTFESFQIYPIETLCPPDILERVRNKDAYIVLDNSNECFYSSVDGIYQNLIIKAGIPESQIVYISGGRQIADYAKALADKIGRGYINIEWFTGQEFSVQKQMEVNGKKLAHQTLVKKSYPKKFLNLNRRWRRHRPALLALMHERDLLKHGYVSFTDNDFGNSWDDAWYGVSSYYSAFPEMHEKLLRGYNVKDLLPMYVDEKDLVTNRDFMQDSTDAFYLNTYFSVVSETTYDTLHGADGIFLTEKTFKAIAMGHPFVLVAPPGTLAALRECGYKTFGHIINEDYDKEQDDGKRMLMIVDEIDRLCNLNPRELNYFLDEARFICTYNFKKLMTQDVFFRKTLSCS